MEQTMQDKIKSRTKGIGLSIIRMVEELPSKPVTWMLTKQILRSSTSIGSNYRAACRAKSNPDFINKLKIVEEETDETIYWLEIMLECDLIPKQRASKLIDETSEILAIIVASIKTSRSRYN